MSHLTFTSNVEAATKLLNLSDKTVEKIKTPENVFQTDITIKRDDGSDMVLPAYRVQHNSARGPYKGVIRFHHEVDLEEVTTLASLMSLKCALVNIPLGGGKGGVQVNTKELSLAEIERVAREFFKAGAKAGIFHPDKDVPAPDMYTNPQVMAWMLDEYERFIGLKSPAVITGKPLALGGSLVREYATAQGGFFILQEYCKKHNKKPSEVKIAIEGFGNAGSYFAEIADRAGFKIVAASDSKGGIFCAGDQCAVPKLKAYKQNFGSLRGNFCQDDVPNLKRMSDEQVELLTAEELLALDIDVLVLAALGDTVTEKNAHTIKAKTILELANGPVNFEADRILFENGVTVIPDILANAGGVVVSYFEWVQNRSGDVWDESTVLKKLQTVMINAWNDLQEVQGKHSEVQMRTTAFVLALERIANAMDLRGWL